MHLRTIAALIGLLAPSASPQTPQLQATALEDALGAPLVFSAPIGVVSPPRDRTRLFVLERAGRIRLLLNGVLQPTPFLDLTASVSTVGEGGLLGLVFHPDYANNGRFFVSYSENTNLWPIVEEYAVSADPNVANPASAVAVFGPYFHGSPSHYAGDLRFGLDGKLYYALGHASETQTSQDLSVYDGKMLRLDIDLPAPHVPTDNPYSPTVGGAPDLTWASGLRNPYRFSFDRLTGDRYIGNVGAILHEEVDFQPANVGGPGSPGYMGGRNYGFPCMEGPICTNSPQCLASCPAPAFSLPIHSYAHGSGAAVIGGFAYRGSAIQGMQGRYFYADFVRGEVRSFLVSGGSATAHLDHTFDLRGTPPNPSFAFFSSFGEDADGEVYVTCLFSGNVFRIAPTLMGCRKPFNFCATSPNSVGSGAVIGSTGSASITANEFVLTARHCPPHSTGLFILGTTQVSVPFGNGTRCVGGPIVRASIVGCDQLGNVNMPYDFVAHPVAAGSTSTIQFYYRDALAGGAAFNLSDGRSVTFCP